MRVTQALQMMFGGQKRRMNVHVYWVLSVSRCPSTGPMKPQNIFTVCFGVSSCNPDRHPGRWALSLSPFYRWRHRVREEEGFIQGCTASKRQHQGSDFHFCRAPSRSLCPKTGDAMMLWTSRSHCSFVMRGEA